MKYEKVLALLEENSDEEYKKFHTKLKAEGEGYIYGVRVPKLREISKEIIKDEPFMFINNIKFNSYEEKVLYGMVVAGLKCDFQEKLKLFTKFIDVIDSWAVCDIVSFKVSGSKKDEMWNFLTYYFNSDKEFHLRFAVINSMQNFMDDEYIDRVLEIYEAIDSKYYYVNMAIAWALQVAFVKQKEKTYDLFEKASLSKEVINKAVQKIRDSRRVDAIDKEKVLKYKIK